MRPPRALPTAHFERNDVTTICETVQQVATQDFGKNFGITGSGRRLPAAAGHVLPLLSACFGNVLCDEDIIERTAYLYPFLPFAPLREILFFLASCREIYSGTSNR
jgi:hypothetical protein